jgi:putative transposase
MRDLVRGMCRDWAVSIRTACGALGFDLSMVHCQSRRTGQAAVAKRIGETCETPVRHSDRLNGGKACARAHVMVQTASKEA